MTCFARGGEVTRNFQNSLSRDLLSVPKGSVKSNLEDGKGTRKNENSIGWKRFGSFISLHLAYRRKSVCFCSFYEAKHFFFVFFSKKKMLKINAPNSFFENESNFFYIISDFFNKFLKT